jgi:hypothetical protein
MSSCRRKLQLAFASRDERAVIGCGVAPEAVTADGVPNDLMW